VIRREHHIAASNVLESIVEGVEPKQQQQGSRKPLEREGARFTLHRRTDNNALYRARRMNDWRSRMDVVLDLLQFVFTPGPALLTALAVLPVGVAAKLRSRHRAKARNRQAKCGECNRPLLSGSDEDVLVYEGTFVCEACAARLRTRLTRTLPVLGLLTAASGAYIVLGLFSGGPLTATQYVLPTLAIGVGGWLSVKVSKSANTLKAGESQPLLNQPGSS
jgi:hypothetical protein